MGYFSLGAPKGPLECWVSKDALHKHNASPQYPKILFGLVKPILEWQQGTHQRDQECSRSIFFSIVLPLRRASNLLFFIMGRPSTKTACTHSLAFLQCLRSTRRHHHLTAHPRHRFIDRAKPGGEKGEVCKREAEPLASKPNDAQCSRAPQLRPTARSCVQGETEALVGPITPKAELHYKLETTELYPRYHIRDRQSLKNK